MLWTGSCGRFIADSRSTFNRSDSYCEKLSTKSTTNYYTTSADRRATAQSLGDDVCCCCWVNNADEFEACVGHCDLLDGHASEKREGTCTVHTL